MAGQWAGKERLVVPRRRECDFKWGSKGRKVIVEKML